MTCVSYIPIKLQKSTPVFCYLFIIRDLNSFLWLVVFMVLDWLPKAREHWSLLRSSRQRVLEKSVGWFQEPKQSFPLRSLCVLSFLSSFSSCLNLFSFLPFSLPPILRSFYPSFSPCVFFSLFMCPSFFFHCLLSICHRHVTILSFRDTSVYKTVNKQINKWPPVFVQLTF